MIEDHANTKAQPAPVGGGASVTDAVIADMLQRREQGTKKYGIELTTHNGRDAEVDAYQEALDLVMYQKQRLMERDEVRRLTRQGLLELPFVVIEGVRYIRRDSLVEAVDGMLVIGP